jgi:tetratricopeptide (TPR) repeat protein
MKRPAGKSPHELALGAVRQGRHAQALEHFAAAVVKSPKDTAVRLDYARFLQCLFRYREAREHLVAACEAMPDEAAVRFAAARLAAEGRSVDLALEWYGCLAGHAPARYHAAVLLERVGRLDEAGEQLAAAERLAGETVDGRLLAARLAAREGDFGRSLAIAEQALTRAPGHFWPQARLHYARGHAFDGLGDFDEAFSAWSEAKRCLQGAAGDRVAEARKEMGVYEALAGRLTEKRMRELRERGEVGDVLGGPSPILITGFPRSGTTLLDRRLVGVTGIPSADENDAFRDLVWNRLGVRCQDADAVLRAVERVPPGIRGEGISSYRTALENLADAREESRWVFDKNPPLLATLPAVLCVMPDLPVVVIHRDPRDVLISFFAQPFGLNFTSVHFLSLGDGAAHYAGVRRISERLREVLGERMIETRYEAVVADPVGEIGRVAGELGRLCGTTGEGGEERRRVSWSPTYAEVEKPVVDRPVGRWRNYARHLEEHLGALERWLEGG